MQDNRDDLYLNLRDAGVGEDVIGTQQDFKNFVTNEKNTRDLYKNLRDAGVGEDVIGSEDDFYNFVAPDFSGNKSSGTTKVGSAAQQVVNEYDQSAKDNAEAEEDLSAATSGAKIGGNISFAPAKPNNQQTVQPDVDNTAKSVMDASGTPAEQAKATGPKTQFVPEDPNYVQATPTAEALKKYPWMQPDQVYMWNRTTKEPVVTYVDESGHAVIDEDLQIKKAKSEITGQDDTEYMYPEAAALQLPNGNTTGLKIKKGALTQMADEILRKEYGDNYLNTQFGKDGNVYTGAERRDLGAQQLYDELNSDVRNARISFAVADEKDRNEILSRIKAKWGKVADETSLVNAVSDENAAKEDIDIVAQQNINDLNAEIQNISRQMDQRGAEIDNASSPFVDQTFNARDVDPKYRILQSKLNYAQNALKSWENVKNSSSLNAFSGFKDAIMDISAWDFGFSDLKNSIALLTAKGKDKQELVNLYGRSAEAAKFEDKYNPDSYRYGKIAGASIPFALQFVGTGGGFKSIGSAVSKKATSIAEKYALEGLKKQVVKGLGVAVGDIARAYTMSGTIQGLNTISDILNRSAGELTVDKQGNYQLKSDEPLLKSIYKGVTASAIENYTEMLGERLNIGGNLMRMLPKIGLGRVSNAITKIGTQDWYRVCNNWLSRAGVNDFGGEVLEEEIGIILNAALVGDNPLFNGSGGLLDVRTQKDILGGMLYSISAMRAGALAMYGVKKGVGSAFVKTLDMYDKMQLNQSDKGGQSIFGEGWTEIKDEIDNTPNDKVNAVIEKLAKEHPSKDEQSAIIDYAVKLLKTRGHNLGIAMASDGENDEGAQEEIKDMPDLSQPNAEYLNKDDGMIHKASLYPDASDPTGTAKDVFIIKGNLVTNEDGSINKDASDDTIIYIDGNGERHIASPDKFAAAYPPMSNNEVLQANEGGENEEAQTTTFNKGDEVNINVDGNNYTATIQGTDGFGNYNVYYEDEIGMMHPAKFTADQLNEMNGKSTVSNGQQATSEQPADVQQQVEQPVVEQPAQQEQETQLAQQAQEEQKSAIPKDEKGNALYHQVPVETTINDLYDGKLDDNEIRDFVDANISEADKNLEKINKKAPKIGINKAEYLKKKQEWQKQVEDATRIRDYWNGVKDYIAQQTHTTPEEVKAAQDELSGEAARREYQDMGGSVQQDAVSVASDFIRGAKITPESFKAETGYGTDEQRKFVGMIAKAEKGGKTIDRLAEELVSYDNAEMNGVLFGGDTSSAKDAILSALQGAGTRGELKQTNEAEEQAYIDARNAARDAQYMDQYGMTYEEYLAYEEQIMPTIWREYNNYDETAFNNMYAEEIEQLIKSRENDTTGEEQADDRGNQVLSEQQVTEQQRSAGSTEPGTEVQAGVQGTDENAVAPEEAQQQAVAQKIATAEAETDTNPTEGQKEAGNYKKGHVRIDGYDITIEQPKGSVRRGTDADGKQWEQTMNNTYGYIRGTEGVDGDHIDIFLSDNPTEGNVYVVDQVNPDGSFDEHKVMYGFQSAEDARAAYLSNYEEGWQGLGTITKVSKDEFKKWVNSSKRKTKPFSEYKSVNAIGAQNEERNDLYRESNAQQDDVTNFSKKHNLKADNVMDYANYMSAGNLVGASNAFREIRRNLRIDNKELSLGEFTKKFSPIKKELYEKFGNIDELHEQYVQAEMQKRNMMEAARKRAEEATESERKRLQALQDMTNEQLDSEYMKAVEANDEIRMRNLVNEAARRNGYGDTGSEYQGVGAWTAPGNPGYESDEARRAAVANDAPSVNITDIANGYSQQPVDYFTNLHAYGTDTPHGRESAKAINNAIDEVKKGKNPMVKVYRAVPKSVKEGKLRNGDWVTPSRKYAEMHGDNRLEGDYRIIEQEVPASQLWWDGNDINEWGFDDGKGYAYRNTKNNRKLNDLITRDDKGNIIPLSQRFNARKADVRYRNTENQAATDNIEDVNKQFNQQLEGLTEENADKVTLSLGRPSAVLRAAGVEDKPMKLYGNKVIKKMRKHGFTLTEIKDLPRAVADPIAVFNNYQKNGNRSILTELQIGDKHILVSVTVGKTGVDADFNIVSSVFGKGSNNVVDWINKGYATFINKEKALDYLHFSERSISEASDNQELVSTANIIRNFENPNVLEENLVPTEQTNDIDTAVADTANKLNIGVRVAHSIDEVNNDSVRRAIEQGRRIQGFYDTRTGEIVVYAPNAVDAEDAVRTVLHEGVAHYGLRQLVGEENFGTFLDNIYNNVSDELKQQIDAKAREHNWSARVATEEYLASLAEDTNFEQARNSGIWQKIKDFFMDLLTKAGIRLNNALSDNELRYILWRSYENLKEPGRYRSIIGEVRDITKQRDLNVGNFAVQNTSEKVAENNNDEINRIVEEAKANGTYMKAPNGSDTNLNERQWAQVRTKAFKDWFGDWENDPENASKVIDENGEPKVVYHGSRSKSRINVFEEMYEKGTFFSTSKNVGSIYSSNNPDNLYSAFINAKNPLIVDNKGKDWNKIDAEDLIEAAEKMFNITKEEFLESLGEDRYITTDGIVAVISRLSEENKSPYDGLILKNVIETNDNEIATDVVAIKSNQIKSATDNTGAFSSDDDDIRYRFIGETGAKNLDAAEEATTRLDNLSVAREMENAYNEKKARIEKLKDSKPVDVKYNGEYDLNRKPAKDWLKENVRGEYTNNDTGEKIGISKVGINEVTSHGSKDKAHLKSLIAIPQMIEQSIFIDEIPNTKGHDKYDSYKYYVCGLKIDNVDYIVKLVVGVKGDNKYYDHRLTEIEKGTLIDNLNGLSNSVAENQNANISYGKDTKLQSILQTNDRENARKIKLATGWERGADGKWRYETADFEYHPKGDARRNDKYKESEWYKELHVLEEKLFNGETLTDGETKRFDELSARVNAIRDNDRNTERIYLDDYVEDNELFKAYPELKQTKIDFVDLPNEEYSAKYNEEENRITVNQAKSIDDKSAIAHEVQHAIQHIEGFAKGSSVDNYNSVPTSENVINDIIDATDGHILDVGGFDNTPEGIFNALNRKTTYGTILRDYSSKLDDIANKYGYETIFDLVNDIDKFKSSVEMYLSEAGEVEARNAERRMNMTPEQRRQSLASETEDVAREDQLFIYDNLGVSARQGTGALTDSELSNANDPAGKMLGKPSRTPAQQKAFAERERQRMADRAREVADILHLDNVEIVTDASTLQGRRAKAKGFYSRDNGKIVIVVPNHVDMADIEQTVLHEAVAHYGLRKLFGSNFDTFLYNVYNNADMDVREKISQLAAQHNWNFATATEEYLASLAEKTNFENLNASWWDKIKSLFLKLLHSIGLKGFTGVSLSDNELRYILWRSYENLKNPGRYRSIIDEAKDITMQNELRVGNYSAGNSEAVGKAAENGVVNIEDVNRRFNEELGRLTEENAQSVILNLGRPGNFLLASGLSDRPIKLYGNKLLKKMRKHGFTTSDVKNLPKEINNPIAVFKGSVENSFAILTELEINGNNVLASISVGKGNDIDFNIISSVYGKNGNSVVSWINDGKILYVNKEKALNYLRISAPIAEAQDNQELSSAANIVKNFENPNISEENMRYGNGALAASESNGINKTNETNGQEAEEANRRFNEELNAFKAKTHKGLLHLGQPGRILNACGINEELTLSPTVLSRKLKQHGLNVDDIKGLAGAIQEPILVYQHGDAHPNMVIVTDLAAKGGKVSVAVELDGEGNVVELNNVSSVHSKGATTELERLSNMRDGYLEQALRWVDKNKVSDWLGIADLNSPIHANNPKLVSIANILQNFENPSVGEENILYREAKKVEKKINSDWRDEYDKKLSKFSFKLTEAAQDAMRSVKILQDIIAKETSAPIRDDENVYWRENRLSSVNKYEQEYYNENYCKPIVTEIANLVKYGARYNDKGEDIINSDNDVLKYLIAKSGLERNQSKREVEAMNARKPYEDQIKELQKQVEKEEIKEENANKKIAKLQEQADKAEMNKRVAVLHKDYSGLTELFQDEKDFDTLATSYVSDFEKKFDTESLWNAINRATKETLRKAFVDGLISRESYESTAKMYKYYIPLRGWANDVASEAYNYKGSGEGSRKILQTAKGRTSLADNPISEIGRMMQDAIFQGNRNRMKQAVYNLAMNHDTSLLNIKRQWYQNMGTEEDPAWERVFPDLNSDMTADQVAEEVEDFESRMRELKKEGKATQSRKGLILRLHTTKREEAQHRISVAINGKEYNIFVNGNPRAAQAINGELNDVDRYGSAVAKVNRFLSQVYTSINPEFVVTNYQRDAGFAASIVASTEPWSYQKEWAKNMTVYNPITTGVYLNRLIKKAKTGNINPSNKAERYMQEFLSHGGETGFTNMLSADDYKKQIKRDIKSINSVVSLSKASRAAVAFTERANTVFEDATRYATYVTSREQGRTIDRSIRDAKEISLNFNTRGADGLPGDGFIYRFFRGLRRWMIFVNPSIQGLNKAGMAFRNHPLRSSMMIAGLPTLLGYALPAIMRAVVGGGDGDDDDKNVVESYKDLPKWVRRTNIAIPIGGNNFVTIPLSYELRVSYGLGEMVWEYGEGMIDKDEVATETLSQLSDLLPISFSNGTVAQSISPSIARPLIDVIQNRNFYGKKIYNDSQFIEGYPEYMKAYAGTHKWLVKSTEVLNNVIPNLNAGVSDKYTPGAINVNPAIIDYLLSSYLGGLYNFPSKFGKTISMIWDEDMRDIQNVPIVSRNWKNSQSGNPYNSGDRYKTYMKEYDLSKQRFNGYKKEAEHDVPEFLKSLNDLLDTPSGKRMLMIDAYKRDGLDKLNRRIRDIDTYGNEKYEGEKDALTKRRDGLKEELINKLDSISDGTLDFVNGEWTRK